MNQQNDLPMETEICHNCKKEVPQANYLMHVAHCARNMAVCPICGDAVPKAHLKDHKQQQHTLVECKDCRFKVQNGAMEQHKANSCGKRVVACQYCELDLPNCDIPDHENYCGARTERCEDCAELVMMKYKKLHLDSNHGFLKLDDEPGPAPSWECRAPSASRNRPAPARSSLTDFRPLRSALPPVNVNETVETSCADNKTDYKRPVLLDDVGAPRDAPRTLITPYDASEDLRAKVKLARHDLNEIKNSYLSSVHETRSAPSAANELLSATNKKPRDKFVTNLVPYEKNKSFAVNAMPLDDDIPKKMLNSGKPKKYFNYLGAAEALLPLSNGQSVERPPTTSTGALKKHTSTSTSNGTVPKQRDLGAVPRTSKKKAPAPPPPVCVPTAAVAESPRFADFMAAVTLPCEFCTKMIPAMELVQHETGCRPDLAQLVVDGPPQMPVARPPSSPEVELPCEFCLRLYPASKLLSHQALCDV